MIGQGSAWRSASRVPGAAIAVALALAGATALGACSKDDIDGSAVANAAGKTIEVKGMRWKSVGHVTVPGLGTTRYTAKGRANLRASREQADVNMWPLGRKLRKRLPPEVASLAGSRSDWQMRVVRDRRTAYFRMGFLRRELPAGKDWLSLDIYKVNRAAGIDDSLTDVFLNTDPRQVLDFLRTTSDRVERLGQEHVNGIDTTHYRATVDIHRYADLVPGKDRARAERSVERLIDQFGSDTFDVDVWVDDNELVRQTRTSFSVDLPDGGGEMTVRDNSEYSGFGKRAKVAVPPRSATIDVTKAATAKRRRGQRS